MKKIIIFMVCLMLMAGSALTVGKAIVDYDKMSDQIKSFANRYPTERVRELPVSTNSEEFREFVYPRIKDANPCFVQNNIGYFIIGTSISSITFEQFILSCKIFERLRIEKIVVILNSPGGSAFAGLGIAQLIEEQKAHGMTVEMHCYGYAASAAAIIMSAGSRGYRYIAPNSFVMIHELLSFKFVAVESVSDTEKEASIKRMIQNEMIKLLVRNTNLSQKELIEKCKEESWANAEIAIKWGFADKLIK